MKIKDLKILPDYFNGVSFKGLDRIGAISWKELILEEVDESEGKIKVKIGEGFESAGQEMEKRFQFDAYNGLTGEKRNKVNKIFRENIGKPVEAILEIEI